MVYIDYCTIYKEKIWGFPTHIYTSTRTQMYTERFSGKTPEQLITVVSCEVRDRVGRVIYIRFGIYLSPLCHLLKNKVDLKLE